MDGNRSRYRGKKEDNDDGKNSNRILNASEEEEEGFSLIYSA